MINFDDLNSLNESFNRKILPFIDKRTKTGRLLMQEKLEFVFDEENMELKLALKDVVFKDKAIMKFKNAENVVTSCLKEAIEEFVSEKSTEYNTINVEEKFE